MSQLRVESIGIGEYAGFSVDGDHLFCLSDGTVVHNSWEFARRLIIRAACQKLTVLCTRELQRSIKDSVHRLLVSQIEILGLSDHFHWDKTHLLSNTGSEFLFYGLRYNPEEIKSTEGVDICWLEEAQATKQESLDMLIPTIRKPGSEIWCTYNPKHIDDPVHNMFCVERRDNAIVKHVNWDDNPWFPEELKTEMEQLRRINPKLALRIWDGKIIQIGGGDYFPSEKANLIDGKPEVFRRVRGWDLAATEPSDVNPDPDYTAGVEMGIDKDGRVIVFDVKRGQLNANSVRNLIKKTAEADTRVHIRIPQDPGQAGKEQAASYRRMLSGYSVTTMPVTGDKETRSESLSAEWQAGNVYLVRGDWNEKYLEIMNAFPTDDMHDDEVDASNDAFSELIHGVAEASIGRTTGVHN
ncbi:MAG: PBSX family phage terminase large subunit [Pseudomonadota bacterium]